MHVCPRSQLSWAIVDTIGSTKPLASTPEGVAEDEDEEQALSSLWNTEAIDLEVVQDGQRSVQLLLQAGSTAPLRLLSVASTAAWATIEELTDTELGEGGPEPQPEEAGPPAGAQGQRAGATAAAFAQVRDDAGPSQPGAATLRRG